MIKFRKPTLETQISVKKVIVSKIALNFAANFYESVFRSLELSELIVIVRYCFKAVSYETWAISFI